MNNTVTLGEIFERYRVSLLLRSHEVITVVLATVALYLTADGRLTPIASAMDFCVLPFWRST